MEKADLKKRFTSFVKYTCLRFFLSHLAKPCVTTAVQGADFEAVREVGAVRGNHRSLL